MNKLHTNKFKLSFKHLPCYQVSHLMNKDFDRKQNSKSKVADLLDAAVVDSSTFKTLDDDHLSVQSVTMTY